ncbi:MAG: twin-arginine translocase subunit TatC, partial [Planctomycetes bacterium]|nr:twin-arginine translocase subunit TatC [Planctomycetota bacterium]
LPLIVSTAVRFRIIQREHIAKHRRIIIFVSAVLGALLTPTGDPISMGLVAVPIYLLIEGGAVLGTIWKRFADQRASHDPKTIAEGFAEGLGTAGQDKDNNSKGSGGFAESFASSVSGLAKSFGRNIEEGAAEFRRAADEDATQGTVTADDEALPRYQAPVAEPRPAPLVSPVTPRPPVGQPSAPTKPQAPATPETSPERPVPQLPRELRRRIDAYIRERLDQLLDEIGKEQKKDNDGKEEDRR